MLRVLKDLELVRKFFISNEQLFNCSFADEDLLVKETWYPSKEYLYVGKYRDDKLIAIVRYKPFTSIAIDMHMHVLPEYWNTGTSDAIEIEFCEFLRKETPYRKIVVQTPAACDYVIKALARAGYICEGVLHCATLWRGQLNAICLFGKILLDKDVE